jgi:hypothetical protein
MAEPTDDELKRELLLMDIQLRRRQIAWETPRNIAIIVGATAAIMGAIGGFIGYKIGQTPPVVIQVQQPAR